jgi:hypothetical protein
MIRLVIRMMMIEWVEWGSDETLERLTRETWNGNVRDLELWTVG